MDLVFRSGKELIHKSTNDKISGNKKQRQSREAHGLQTEQEPEEGKVNKLVQQVGYSVWILNKRFLVLGSPSGTENVI